MTRIILLVAFIASGCLGVKDRVVTAVELRAAVVQLDWSRLPEKTRTALWNGQLWSGASEVEVYVARGEPRLWWNTRVPGQPGVALGCKILVYTSATDPALADTSVTACNGAAVAVKPIEPALPCWRLAEVGPRIVAASGYFDGLRLATQWQIVAGILARGQAEQDVTIAFGEPYNRGFDEREDGTHADQLVFLDHGRNAYGLNVTLIGNKVAGWKMPAERRLTPEAEQRRLDALEKRITTKIAELEELTKRQHAETVKLFNDVMRKQDDMIATLTAPPVIQGGSSRTVDPGNEGATDGDNTAPVEPDKPEKKPKSKPRAKPEHRPEAKACSCPEVPCNDYFNAIKVRSCKATCTNSEPVCNCGGKCETNTSGNATTVMAIQHSCGCN